MGNLFKRLSFAALAVTCASGAWAADLPAPVINYVPEVPAVGGWYLRGDIGYKIYNQPSGSYDSALTGDLRFEREDMDEAWMVGVGIGYQFNDYFRSDLTLDYEDPADVKGYAVCGGCAAPGQFSTERTSIDIWSVMFNSYVDLGTWYNLTPYVGAGVGASYVRTHNTFSINPDLGLASYPGSNGEWNFAWALMAGVSYAVTPNWSIDAGYQYRDLGTAKTVRLTDAGNARIKYEDLTAHEIRLGVRYNFGSTAPAYEGPQMANSGF